MSSGACERLLEIQPHPAWLSAMGALLSRRKPDLSLRRTEEFQQDDPLAVGDTETLTTASELDDATHAPFSTNKTSADTSRKHKNPRRRFARQPMVAPRSCVTYADASLARKSAARMRVPAAYPASKPGRRRAVQGRRFTLGNPWNGHRDPFSMTIRSCCREDPKPAAPPPGRRTAGSPAAPRADDRDGPDTRVPDPSRRLRPRAALRRGLDGEHGAGVLVEEAGAGLAHLEARGRAPGRWLVPRT